MSEPLIARVRGRLRRLAAAAVQRGLPARWMGYRSIRREALADHAARRGAPVATAHPAAVARHPLPRNVADRDALPGDRGWWGYSFRDVPARPSAATFVVTVRDALVTWYHDADQDGDFFPAVVAGGRGLDLREVRFRTKHGAALRAAAPPVRLERATWVVERVYHNYSHWLTAHLPKMVLLDGRGELGDVLLPAERPSFVDASLRLVGIDPDALRTFAFDRPLRVDALTVWSTDRFRPELLRAVRGAVRPLATAPPRRRVYVSRARAGRRRLLSEEAVWAVLEPAGFERVVMEDLAFEAQVALMQETAALVAPHGAGLTNMMFCPEGTHVVEIADLGFPNPNFYAVASAMGHPYWILDADSVGDGPLLERDLTIDPAAVAAVLPDVLRGLPDPPRP